MLVLLINRDTVDDFSIDASWTDNRRVIIKCRSLQKFNSSLINVYDCRIAKEIAADKKIVCSKGCIGLMSCIDVCRKGAIDRDLQVNHRICNACGECVEICPQNLIELIDGLDKVFVACNNDTPIKQDRDLCDKGCRKCYICIGKCPNNALSIDDIELPLIDCSKCVLCKQCVFSCPTGAMSTLMYEK